MDSTTTCQTCGAPARRVVSHYVYDLDYRAVASERTHKLVETCHEIDCPNCGLRFDQEDSLAVSSAALSAG